MKDELEDPASPANIALPGSVVDISTDDSICPSFDDCRTGKRYG